MKNLVTILFLLIFSTVLFGTTYHTITIDGNNDFDTATEQFTTTSGTTLLGYITWDENYIYLGFSGNSPAGSITDDNRVYHFYIDTDPHLDPKTGNGTTDGETWRWDPTLPFNADYHYSFQTANNAVWQKYYNGSSWVDANFSDSNWKGNSFWEVRISRADIGNPSQIYLLGYVEEDWTGGYICGGVPDNLFTNTNTQGSILFNDHWLGFTLTSGVEPNSASNNDASLPVTLHSFTANCSDNAVSLQWVTQSEIDVLGYEIQRALDENGPFTTIASYRDYAELRAQGNYSAKTDYQFTDITVTPGFTYWYKLISHDLDGSQQTFGPISVSVRNNNADIQPVAGSIPEQYQLKQNFPNPFNLSTEIRFGIPQTSSDVQDVNLSVYDMSGKKIVELLNAPLSAGSYRVFWNGKDATGKVVPTGIYFYRLSTSNFVQARKMLLVK